MFAYSARLDPAVCLAAVLMVVAAAAPAGAQTRLFEDFDENGPTDPNGDGPLNLIAAGWIFSNQSDPIGLRSWFDGFLGGQWPQPQNGTGYLAVDGLSTDYFGGRVSNWAVLPAAPGQQSDDVLSFHLLDLDSSNVNTLQVRYSPSRGTDTGSGPDDVGDFTQLLLEISPLPVGGWNRFEVTLPGDGRIALRYYIADACNWACFGSYTGLDSLTIGERPDPPCNLPPIPAQGQSVTWTLANSPYRVCENIAIPPDATVVVEPGVQVDFDQDRQLVVSGRLRVDGTEPTPVRFDAAGVFPPMVSVRGGTLDAAFLEFGGQLRVESAATVRLTDCGFAGFGMIWAQELQPVTPYISLTRCAFTSSQMSISDAIVVLDGNTFVDTYASLLRGYADVTRPNAFIGNSLEIIREESTQPMYVDGVQASGVAGSAGLMLDGGDYLLGPGTELSGNLYGLSLRGGLVPGSRVPTAGNANNVIAVGNGGFAGWAHWPDFGIPYWLTEPASSLPGGHLTVAPGVVVEAIDPYARLSMIGTRRVILEGTPAAPITFRAGEGSTNWPGLYFATNSSTGARMDYVSVEDANFGVIAADMALYVDNCVFRGNAVGANTNTYGAIFFARTQFLANSVGVSTTDLGSPLLKNPAGPNLFEGNGAAMDVFEPRASFLDATHVWWGHPTGPQHPRNPDGQGDAIIGVGAGSVSIFPFLTSRPDLSVDPPVVRLVEPGPQWSDSPSFFLDPGTKFVIRWDIKNTSNVARQRILFSPDGDFLDRYWLVVDDLPGSQRSYEWTVPNPGFAVTNQPQFIRVAAVDAAGREGWDHMPLLVSSQRIPGTLTITTDLTGRTFHAGDAIPDLEWTGGLGNFPTIDPYVVLESDGAAIAGLNIGGRGMFFELFPNVCTDRARLALRAHNNSNDVVWFFAPGTFSIRHDPRLGFQPPTVDMTSPQDGQAFAGGSVVPVAWTASAVHGLHGFDVQASYDAGRTWHWIAYDLPADARNYDWRLPPSDAGVDDVRLRVIVRDGRFQNSAAADRTFRITPGSGGRIGDMNCDGSINGFDVDGFVLALSDPAGYAAAYPECDIANGDINADGSVDGFDVDGFVALLGG